MRSGSAVCRAWPGPTITMSMAPPPGRSRLRPIRCRPGDFYFDGVTSKRHDVIVETARHPLRIIDDESALTSSTNGTTPICAPLGAGRHLAAGPARGGGAGAARGARRRAGRRHRRSAHRRSIAAAPPTAGLRQRVVVLSLAAIASLVLTAVFGMPVLANKITPLIPLRMEKKFGEAIDKQVRPMLDTGDQRRGLPVRHRAPARRRGRKALDKLVQQLEQAATRALSCAGRGGAPASRQCVRPAGRPRLCVRRAIGEERDAG